MAWDSVPWFVGGGAEHSPEVARLTVFAATGGTEGIVSVSDLRVEALPTPGAAVQIDVGAALILARSQGGDHQTYAGRLPTADQVSVAPTSGGGSRSDLVVARVEDPFMAGEPWQTPGDVTVGPYIFTRVISNVPPTTVRLQDVPGHEADSGIALARIDLPPSTSAVTSAMIVDLRKTAIHLSTPVLRTYVMQDTDGDKDLTTQTAYPTGTIWPSWISGGWGSVVDVPIWANRCRFVMTWVGVFFAHNAWGEVWADLGQNDAYVVHSQAVKWDSPEPGSTAANLRENLICADDIAVPVQYRGQPVKFVPRGTILGGTSPLLARMDAHSAMILQAEFYNKAE